MLAGLAGPGDHPAGARPDGPQPGVLRRRALHQQPDRAVRGTRRASCPPLVLVATYVLARLAHPRLGAIVHGVLVAALGRAVRQRPHPGARRRRRGPRRRSRRCSGRAVALLVARARAGRLLLQYLAAANVLFLAGFLFASPTSDLISHEATRPARSGYVSVPVPPGPVVVIVFDELPLPTLMRSDGTINAERYPAFARLAESATWYRNASSPHNRTERARARHVTGDVAARPAHADRPSLPAQPPRRSSARRCPSSATSRSPTCARPDACTPRKGQPLSQALEDSLVVYGHRCCPSSSVRDLPPIDDAWGSFGDTVGSVAPAPAAAASGSSADPSAGDPLERWHGSRRRRARARDPGRPPGRAGAGHRRRPRAPLRPRRAPPRAVVRHAVGHPPDAAHAGVGGGPDQPGYAWSGLIRYQRHSLQTGAGRRRARARCSTTWRSSAFWEDTTLVVVADHGTSTIQPDVGRDVTDANAEEVLRVPFFVKAAGQVEGRSSTTSPTWSTCSPR